MTDISHYNVNENKSILTFILTSEIENVDNVYYIKIKDLNAINKNEVLVYNFNEEVKSGEFLEREDEMFVFTDLNEDKLERVHKTQILGRLIYNKNEEN